MKLASRFLCALTLALTMLVPSVTLAQPTAIYLVRHAEKEATGKDPALTAHHHRTADVTSRRRLGAVIF